MPRLDPHVVILGPSANGLLHTDSFWRAENGQEFRMNYYVTPELLADPKMMVEIWRYHARKIVEDNS